MSNAEPTPPIEQPSEKTWQAFYARVQLLTGLDLHLYRPDQLRRRILSAMHFMPCESLDKLATSVSESKQQLAWLLDHLAINVTEFYRNHELWELLSKNVLSELVQSGHLIRCWSAGCSTGCEAFTLATVFLDLGYENFEILGTDIDSEALATAQRAVYSLETLGATPQEVKEKYFNEQPDGSYQVIQKVREKVVFLHSNILADAPSKNFELIVCRNVVIYFTDDAKHDLYQRFYEALAPSGYLFLGASERIINPISFGYLNPWPYIYRR